MEPIFCQGSIKGEKVLLDKFDGMFLKNTFKGTYLAGEGNRRVPFLFSEQVDLLSNSFDFYFDSSDVAIISNTGKEDTYFAATIWPKILLNAGMQVYFQSLIKEQFDFRESIPISIQQFLNNQRVNFYSSLRNKEKLKVINEQEVLIVFKSSKFISIASITNNYTADTPGNYNIIYTVADLLHKNSLALIDIVGTDGVNNLPLLLEKYYRKKYIVSAKSTLEKLGFVEHTIQPNDNFYITAKGIGFTYLKGEIAGSSAGQIEIFIPFTELKAYLTPAINTLLR